MPSEAEQPITRTELRAELEGLETRLETRLLAAIGQAIGQAISQAKTEILETTQEYVRDAQTEILRAFYTFESSREVRFQKLQTEVKGIDFATDSRIGNLEQRLMVIEERLLINRPRPQ